MESFTPGAEALSTTTNRWAKGFRADLKTLAQKCNDLERECELAYMTCAGRNGHPPTSDASGGTAQKPKVSSLAERHAKLMSDLQILLTEETEDADLDATDADSNTCKHDSTWVMQPLDFSVDGSRGEPLPEFQRQVARLRDQGSGGEKLPDLQDEKQVTKSACQGGRGELPPALQELAWGGLPPELQERVTRLLGRGSGDEKLPEFQEEQGAGARSLGKSVADSPFQSKVVGARVDQAEAEVAMPSVDAMVTGVDTAHRVAQSPNLNVVPGVGAAQRVAKPAGFNLAQRGVPTPCRQAAMRSSRCMEHPSVYCSENSLGYASGEQGLNQSAHNKEMLDVSDNGAHNTTLSSRSSRKSDSHAGMDRLDHIKHNAEAVLAARRKQRKLSGAKRSSARGHAPVIPDLNLSGERSSPNCSLNRSVADSPSTPSWADLNTSLEHSRADLNTSLEDKAISDVWSRYHPSRCKGDVMRGSLPEPPVSNRSQRPRSAERSLSLESLQGSQSVATASGICRQRSAPAKSSGKKLNDAAISSVWAKYHPSRGGEAPSWWGSPESGLLGSGVETIFHADQPSLGPSTLPPPPGTPGPAQWLVMPPQCNPGRSPGTPGAYAFPPGTPGGVGLPMGFPSGPASAPSQGTPGGIGPPPPPGPASLPPAFTGQLVSNLRGPHTFGLMLPHGIVIPPLPFHAGMPGRPAQNET